MSATYDIEQLSRYINEAGDKAERHRCKSEVFNLIYGNDALRKRFLQKGTVTGRFEWTPVPTAQQMRAHRNRAWVRQKVYEVYGDAIDREVQAAIDEVTRAH